jgi:hypothetical protein
MDDPGGDVTSNVAVAVDAGLGVAHRLAVAVTVVRVDLAYRVEVEPSFR